MQRGSLELANLTMETDFQQANQNCFTCHDFAPNSPSTPTAALEVSHLFASLSPTILTAPAAAK